METSILFCIKDPIPFVILGGTSGIGKTTLIDYLLDKYSEFFEQPKSYTSREQRNASDRYVFVSKEKMIDLYNKGKLINLDDVHGDFYGIATDELLRIKQLNKIPIKEIHPSNFSKFNSTAYNTISLIIERLHKNNYEPISKRKNREFETFSTDSCDFKINIAGLDIKESASLMIKKLYAHRLHSYNLPHIKKIEEKNETGYNLIAQEFNDNKRITTRNFHDASLGFWKAFFENNKTYSNILELGFGNGWLFDTFNKKAGTLHGIDISGKMHSENHDIIIKSSARNIPYKANYFDCVVGSLIDPILNYETFVEVERVLKPNGLFSFTVPSKEWADNLISRKDKQTTKFVNSDGKEIEVFSFCDIVELLPFVLTSTNFKIVHVESLCIPECYTEPISSAIVASAFTCKKKETDLPIVTSVILKKDE